MNWQSCFFEKFNNYNHIKKTDGEKSLPLPQRLALIGLEGLQEEVDDALLPGLDFGADGHAGVDLQVPAVHVELFFVHGNHHPVQLSPFFVFNGVGADLPYFAFQGAEFLEVEGVHFDLHRHIGNHKAYVLIFHPGLYFHGGTFRHHFHQRLGFCYHGAYGMDVQLVDGAVYRGGDFN